MNLSPFSWSNEAHRPIANGAQSVLERPLSGSETPSDRLSEAANLCDHLYSAAEGFLENSIEDIFRYQGHQTRTFGVYQNTFEPSISLEFPPDRCDFDQLFRLGAEFGRFFGQQAVHLLRYRGSADFPCEDPSVPSNAIWSHCMLVTFEGNEILALNSATTFARVSDIPGLTYVRGDQLLIYTIEPSTEFPPARPATFNRFLEVCSVRPMKRIQEWHSWLWSVGEIRNDTVQSTYDEVLGPESPEALAARIGE